LNTQDHCKITSKMTPRETGILKGEQSKINPCLLKCIPNFSYVQDIVCDDSIIAINLKAEPVNILIMQVYMPISEYEDDEVEKLYDTIEEILEKDGKGDTNSIILGDWNSVVGEESYKNIVG